MPGSPVSVTLMYNHHQHKAVPIELMWQNKHYPVTEVGLHHSFREGRTLFHIFSVVSRDRLFKLQLNSDDLSWKVEEVN